jgi:hypothetical protein
MAEITYNIRIKDNDPRMPNRILQVTGFEGDYVFASIRPGHKNRLTKIRRDRIHCDGKPRRSGWSLIEST